MGAMETCGDGWWQIVRSSHPSLTSLKCREDILYRDEEFVSKIWAGNIGNI